MPTLFNLMTFVGFCAVNSIVGGQVLQAVNPGHLSTAVGIVVIAIVSLVVSFFGYRVLHILEKWACKLFLYSSTISPVADNIGQGSRSCWRLFYSPASAGDTSGPHSHLRPLL